MKVDISVKPKLVYEANGTLCVQKYECGDYLIKVVYDGIDTVASILPMDVAMPSLKYEAGITMLQFPIKGYLIDDVNKIICTIKELKEMEKILKELI